MEIDGNRYNEISSNDVSFVITSKIWFVQLNINSTLWTRPSKLLRGIKRGIRSFGLFR